jgi:quinol monooxygenase YgiN
MDSYYGRHGHFRTQPGQGDALAEILLAAGNELRANDACLLYIISRSLDDADVVWVTEVWTDKGAHDESLTNPEVQASIAQARPLIAGIEGMELRPVGGKGLEREDA